MNTPGARPIRLLLVDYQRAVRRGLKMRFALEPDIEVVGEAGSIAEAIPLTRVLHPDVILMDVELPGGVSGTEAIETLRTATPHSGVVVFTLHDDAATRARARTVGAASVAKHQTEETLMAAIRGVSTEQPGRGGTCDAG